MIEDGTLGPLESVHVLVSGHLIHTAPPHAWDVLDSWCGPTRRRRPTSAAACHIRFANGVDAFVSGGRKSCFISNSI